VEPGERVAHYGAQLLGLHHPSRRAAPCEARLGGVARGQLLFSTHPETITAGNLQVNPALVVHLESGDQVVIVEGTATRLDDRPLLARFGEAYEAKYDWPLGPEDLDPSNPDAAYYAVRPRVALSWGTATEIGETIARWNFEP
jgi:hypothetical protein